jgi:hypothetical protein
VLLRQLDAGREGLLLRLRVRMLRLRAVVPQQFRLYRVQQRQP